MSEKKELCEVCRHLRPSAWTDSVGRSYCGECLAEADEPTIHPGLAYLDATIPFQVGDRVECRTAGVLYDGVGTVDQVSTELENYGTPVYPSFHVVIEDKAYPEAPDELWYLERQLTLVEAGSQ